MPLIGGRTLVRRPFDVPSLGLSLLWLIPYRLAYATFSLLVRRWVSGKSRLTTLRGLFLTSLTNVLLKFLSANDLVILSGLLAVTHCLMLVLANLLKRIPVRSVLCMACLAVKLTR